MVLAMSLRRRVKPGDLYASLIDVDVFYLCASAESETWGSNLTIADGVVSVDLAARLSYVDRSTLWRSA